MPLDLHEPADFLLATSPAITFPASRDSSNQDAEALLLRVIVHEVQTAALITAGAASAVNFAYRNMSPRALDAARVLVDDFHANLEHWPRRIVDNELSGDSREASMDYFAAFRRARIALAECGNDERQIGPERALPLHLFNLSTLWRQAARRARYLILALLGETSHALPTEFASNSRTLDNVLNQIISGDTPCSTANGTIVLPELTERRRSPRRTLLQEVLVRTRTSQYTAFARDVSVGGIGLTRLPPVHVGEHVTVMLMCGRTLWGEVVWSKASHVGVRFHRPLMPTDPLIFG